MTSPTFSLTDISIRGQQTNSQVIVSGVPSRREKKIRTPDRRLVAQYFIRLYKVCLRTKQWKSQNSKSFATIEPKIIKKKIDCVNKFPMKKYYTYGMLTVERKSSDCEQTGALFDSLNFNTLSFGHIININSDLKCLLNI